MTTKDGEAMGEATKRVELPTLAEIDRELEETASRRKWLFTVRRLVAKLEGEPGD